MEIQGIIKMVGETKTFGNNGFRKRELVLTTQEQYPQHLLIEFIQDKTDLLNAFGEGQKVKISINLKGREWLSPQGETKYFNSIQGWRIENMDNNPVEDTSNMPPVPPFEPLDENDSNETDLDDLPF